MLDHFIEYQKFGDPKVMIMVVLVAVVTVFFHGPAFWGQAQKVWRDGHAGSGVPVVTYTSSLVFSSVLITLSWVEGTFGGVINGLVCWAIQVYILVGLEKFKGFSGWNWFQLMLTPVTIGFVALHPETIPWLYWASGLYVLWGIFQQGRSLWNKMNKGSASATTWFLCAVASTMLSVYGFMFENNQLGFVSALFAATQFYATISIRHQPRR